MAYKSHNVNWLEDLIIPAMEQFYESHCTIIANDTAERCVAAHIFCYMKEILNELSLDDRNLSRLCVDCEYNRHSSNHVRDNVKHVYEECGSCDSEQKHKCIKGAMEITNVIPDIIVHERFNDDDNQVVIEIKMVANNKPHERENDNKKLTYFTCNKSAYGYRCGYFIDIAESHYKITCYKNNCYSDPITYSVY